MKLSDKDKRSKLVVVVDIAYEPHINSCLSVHLSKERTIFICYYQFFKQIREKYGGKKPIYTDDGVLNGIYRCM